MTVYTARIAWLSFKGLNPLSLTPVDPSKPLSLWEGRKGCENEFRGESQPCLASRKNDETSFSETLNFGAWARLSRCSQSRASQRPSQPIVSRPSDPRVGRRVGFKVGWDERTLPARGLHEAEAAATWPRSGDNLSSNLAASNSNPPPPVHQGSSDSHHQRVFAQLLAQT